MKLAFEKFVLIWALPKFDQHYCLFFTYQITKPKQILFIMLVAMMYDLDDVSGVKWHDVSRFYFKYMRKCI